MDQAASRSTVEVTAAPTAATATAAQPRPSAADDTAPWLGVLGHRGSTVRAHYVVFVAAGNRIETVDLTAPSPRFVQIPQRDLSSRKAYDLFARDGDWLIAIDDMVVPIFADGCRLDSQGRPTHAQAWELPGVINGRYDQAALVRHKAAASGTLYVTARFGIMSGHGHDLAALPIKAGKVVVPKPLVLNSTAHDDPPVLEEFVPRGTGDEPTLAAGTHHTPWGGMALVRREGRPERIALAAGRRGILLLPLDFKRTSSQRGLLRSLVGP